MAPFTFTGVIDTGIAKAGSAERQRVFDVLVLAFAGDPVERWMYPEPDRYLASFPDFVDAFGGRAFDAEAVWRSGDFGAVALWFPPGVVPDADAVGKVLSETVSQDKHRELYAALEQMEKAHPSYPHWYLPWLGVDPLFQGQGLGGRLLRHCLAIVDGANLPAYLETPNPRTIPFYERHGFAVTGATDVGGCPPITFMSRKAAT